MNGLTPFFEGKAAFSVTDFLSPPAAVAPVYAWVWNGRVDEAGICRQLDEMIAAGIRGFYILPLPSGFRPNTMATETEPPYLSDAYFALVRFALDEGKKRGMAAMLYDEGGWPSGSACGEVIRRFSATARKNLGHREVSAEAGVPYVPGEGTLAAFAEGRRVEAGTVFEAAASVTEYFRRDDRLKYDGTAVQYDFATDIMEPETAREFLQCTHEGYAAALDGMPEEWVTAVFTDEPTPGKPAFPAGIEQAFAETYGYDLLDRLPELDQRTFTPAGEQVRIDYGRLLSGHLRKTFFDPIAGWCREHGVYLTGHLDRDHRVECGRELYYGDPLEQLRAFHIPGVDVIWRQIFPRETGAWWPEDGYPFYPRLASSAAAQTGSGLALAEVFNIYGAGLTPAQMRFVADILYMRGINPLDPMPVSYERHGPAVFAMRPCLIPENPIFGHLRPLNAYFARMGYLTSLGKRAPRPALLMPVEDINAAGDRAETAKRAFIAAGNALEAAGVDFDLIDEAGVLAGTVTDRRLCLGAAEYTALLIPEGINASTTVQAVAARLEGTVTPAVKSRCRLSASKRQTADGDRLFLVMNEGTAPVTDRVVLATGLAAGEAVWRLDALCGTARRLSAAEEENGTAVELTLRGREPAVLLVTEKPLPETPAFVPTGEIGLTDFTLRPLWRTAVSRQGVKRVELAEKEQPCRLGDWRERLGADFSGVAEYTARWEMDALPAGETALLSLGKTAYTAQVLLNGRDIGTAVAGEALRFPVSCLRQGQNEVRIRVANTLANALRFLDTRDWEPNRVGPYAEVQTAFEADSAESGLFGPVVLQY